MVYVEEQKLNVLSTILLLLVHPSDEAAEEAFRKGISYSLVCTGNAHKSDTYFWRDTSRHPSIGIYTANKEGIAKTEVAKDISKYDNFFINNQFPTSTSLILSDTASDDEGNYTCELLGATEIIARFTVHVEDTAEETFLAGTSSFLECIGNADNSDTYLWNDITDYPIIEIYTVNEEGITKTEKAQQIPKYNNFLISSQFPFATSLTMSNIALEDEGTYTCELLVASKIVQRYTVNVEVAPHQIFITCSGNALCPPPPPDLVPSNVECVCTAVGVYPESLEILGNGDHCLQKIATDSVTGPDGTYDISCEYRVYPTQSQDYFQCKMDGYVNNVESESTFIFRSPNCELLVEYNQACTIATLTCSCNNAAPDVNVYNFYDEQKRLFGSPQISEVKEVEIRPNEILTFYCRGCNGVNYGLHSFAEKTFICPHATERPIKTTTQTSSGSKMSDQFWFLILTGLTFTARIGYQ